MKLSARKYEISELTQHVIRRKLLLIFAYTRHEISHRVCLISD